MHRKTLPHALKVCSLKLIFSRVSKLILPLPRAQTNASITLQSYPFKSIYSVNLTQSINVIQSTSARQLHLVNFIQSTSSSPTHPIQLIQSSSSSFPHPVFLIYSISSNQHHSVQPAQSSFNLIYQIYQVKLIQWILPWLSFSVIFSLFFRPIPTHTVGRKEGRKEGKKEERKEARKEIQNESSRGGRTVYAAACSTLFPTGFK